MTHHVDDLLEGEAEHEGDGLRLVHRGPLQLVVMVKEVVEQPSFMRPTVSS